ncbi:MAG: hypothetical protein COW03_06785 [Cytophagales bacterium CG12_big_fil_rev_8_21_14_0_65_40_12]|nr:MAG: hypothetical protein COW03_06785 [Cytophagales bacterium CG12_big_fil_rev_8_21_14_0_65_40_12]PIW04539.1 MAG: hypothetical protein COW40_09035 [Cytophagales bacterium CG17_big_fil_post_rev_8_21_14_2_50_40_13]
MKSSMKKLITRKGGMIMGMAIAIWAVLSMTTNVHARQGSSVSTSTSISNGSKSSTKISVRDGRYTFSSRMGSQQLELEYDGTVEFTDDDKGIKSISKGGYLKIRKTSFGERRELLAEPNSDGSINYEYYEGRRKAEFNDAAKKWLADVLLEVIRTTGIGAEGRVDRFYKNGGVDAVLRETDAIRSDHISHIYLKVLLGTQKLSADELTKVAAYVPRNLDSDHYISEVFKDYGDLFFKHPKSTEAFLSAIGEMDSDHYVSIILNRALREDLSDEMISKVLDAAERMDSDHYKSGVIKEVLDRRDISDAVINRIVRSAADIDSDHYATLVLRDALDRPNLSDKAFENLMDAVANIDSDHYVTETLRSLLKRNNPSDKVVEAIVKRVSDMDSDHYRTIIINDLMRDRSMSSKYFDQILVTVGEVDSDHYASQILQNILKDQALSGENYDKVLARVARIDSDHYKTQILKNVLRSDKLSKSHLLSVLKAVDTVDSDYYKSEILKDACNLAGASDGEVKDLFRRIARSIESDTYYGRVARCID